MPINASKIPPIFACLMKKKKKNNTARRFHHNSGDILFDINLFSRDQYTLKANWPVPLITLNAASFLEPNYAGDACLYKSFPVA